MHPWTTKNWSGMRRSPTTARKQDWHTSRQTSRYRIRPTNKAAAQSGQHHEQIFTRLKRMLHAPRPVWEFPQQDEESI